jgi:hypothetical protein
MTYSEVTSVDVPIVFDGTEYTLTTLKTRAGVLLWQATHVAMLLTGNKSNDNRSVYYHFRRVAMRSPELNPIKRKLFDHLKVGLLI